MKPHLVLSSLILVTLFACGFDPKIVANGVEHTCDARALMAHLEENPDDAEAMRELHEKREFLRINIESGAKEGKRHKLEEEIRAKADETCPDA
jgi:hypothetical protein